MSARRASGKSSRSGTKIEIRSTAPQPPLRLYKYIAPRWTSLLETRRIRFTQPIYFNDPFELAPCITTGVDASYQNLLIRQVLAGIAEDPSVGKEEYHAALQRANGTQPDDAPAYEELITSLAPVIPDLMRAMLEPANAHVASTYYTDLRERIARTVGVLSLAERPDNLLMWAHYGDEHRGVVIGFDRHHPFFNHQFHDQDIARQAKPVVYSPKRPKRAIFSDPGTDEAKFIEALAHDFLLVKSREWSYEREWRMILPATDAVEVRQNGAQDVLLYEFPADAVVEVILGCRATEETEHAVRRAIALPQYKHVEIRHARLHPERFQLVIEHGAE